MTAELDLSHEVYFYAQDLDNAGGTEYWCVTDGGATCNRLLPTDPRLAAVRERLDASAASGRDWRIACEGVKSRVSVGGECVLTVYPQTRDVGGRLSPVLVLFNALAPAREQAAVALTVIPTLMGREVMPNHASSAAQLGRVLSWPRFFIVLHMIFFSRRALDV